MLNRKILRSERHVVFGDGGDDLVFGMLEHRAYAATGGSILVGVRAGLVEHHIARQCDISLIGSHQSGDDT